jgi:cobalamin biosynthesis Mg chelatase CobN
MYIILKNKIVLGHKKTRKSTKLPSVYDKMNHSSSSSSNSSSSSSSGLVAVVVVVVVLVVVVVIVDW